MAGLGDEPPAPAVQRVDGGGQAQAAGLGGAGASAVSQQRWDWAVDLIPGRVCGLQGNSLATREVGRLAVARRDGPLGAGTSVAASDATVEQLHEAARAGSAQAQNELGRRYESGDGVQKDRNAALLFLKLAADQGFAAAQNSLAEILCARLTSSFCATARDYRRRFRTVS